MSNEMDINEFMNQLDKVETSYLTSLMVDYETDEVIKIFNKYLKQRPISDRELAELMINKYQTYLISLGINNNQKKEFKESTINHHLKFIKKLRAET